MPSPFPGMDPYLEDPELWPDVHHGLISQIQSALNPQLRPNYVARVESRIYLSRDDDPGRRLMIPDVRVEVRPKPRTGKALRATSVLEVAEPLEYPLLLDETIEDAYLTIKHRESNTLVAVIEVLSPTNKVSGSCGRESFVEKKLQVLASTVHFLELDLLRGGERLPTSPFVAESDYRVTVFRRGERKQARYWPIQLRQKLPMIGVPLRGKDPDVPLDLGAVLQTAYDVAEWDASIDYASAPNPPLNSADARWANALLRAKGLR